MHSNCKVIYAPQPVMDEIDPIVFLAGSIEMGTAEEWQENLIQEFDQQFVTFLNPRRKDWDSSWAQSIENDQFREQVEWEINGMELSDIIFINFIPDTKSPITLLELGLFSRDCWKNMIVCCPDGFWRKGNVDVVCNLYRIPCFDDFTEAKKALTVAISQYGEIYNV